MATGIVLACLLLAAAAKVMVHSPESLKKEVDSRFAERGLPASLANFGNPPYGSMMIGKVHLPQLKNETKACGSLHPINFEQDAEEDVVATSPILLVERGKCSFSQKVRHAQDIGAKAVLVIDNEANEEDIEKIVISDDGSAGDISIPSFLMLREAGDMLKKTMKEKTVELILSFELGNQTEEVDVTLWMSSGHNGTLKFISEFADSALSFPQGSIRFRPHYVFWHCVSCEKKHYNESHPDCLSGGRYCAPDPDGKGPLTGEQIISEDLRQLCMYKITKKQGWETWFRYVSALYTKCYPDLSESCSYSIMKDFADTKAVKKCVTESFEPAKEDGKVHPSIDDNTLLKTEKNHWLKSGTGFFPAIVINKATYKGDFEIEEVMLAMCASFTTPPPNCDGVLSKGELEMVSFLHLVLTILLVLGVLTGVLVLYRLWMRREMHNDLKSQVTSSISEYVSLNSEERRRSFT